MVVRPTRRAPRVHDTSRMVDDTTALEQFGLRAALLGVACPLLLFSAPHLVGDLHCLPRLYLAADLCVVLGAVGVFVSLCVSVYVGSIAQQLRRKLTGSTVAALVVALLAVGLVELAVFQDMSIHDPPDIWWCGPDGLFGEVPPLWHTVYALFGRGPGFLGQNG